MNEGLFPDAGGRDFNRRHSDAQKNIHSYWKCEQFFVLRVAYYQKASTFP